jgi:hypothetical protein
VIDEYIDELDATLRGPRGAKEDLLTEARDSLVDAAYAHQAKGLDRDAAERQAVAEFGEIRDVAPDYQAELSVTQGRRTALVVFVTHAPQYVVSEYLWRSGAYAWTWRPSVMYTLVSRVVDWAAIATITGSLLAVLACGIGVRYLGVRQPIAKVIGLLAITGFAFFAVAGLFLALDNPDFRTMMLSGPALLWTIWSVLLPLCVLLSARRCLTAAAPTSRPAA